MAGEFYPTCPACMGSHPIYILCQAKVDFFNRCMNQSTETFNFLVPIPLDILNTTCKSCNEGEYVETLQTDDYDGILHCNLCGNQIKRWI